MREPRTINFTKVIDDKTYNCYREVTYSSNHYYSQSVGVHGFDEVKPDGIDYAPHEENRMESVANLIAREIIERGNRNKE